MAGVFLSYDRDDSAKARPIAFALEKAGHSVWWDLHVRGGAQFSKVIEEALKAADAVVVLWSKDAVESPWVRDEAAAGRDSGRLVPVSLDGTEPPLGFRQFQTIDLSAWSGRGRVPRLAEILGGIDGKVGRPSAERMPSPEKSPAQTSRARERRKVPLIAVAGGLLLVLLVGLGALKLRSSGLPTVEVVAADSGASSTAAANDLFVKLGSLAQVGNGKWRLLDSGAAKDRPDLLFRASAANSGKGSSANLVLLDGKENSLLWSREFTLPAGGEADLRQQVSLTAGRVLGCALESREHGGLSPDLLKTFLDACASFADLSGEDYGPLTAQLREVVDRVPAFEPAWSRLIGAEAVALEYARYTPGFSQMRQQLAEDARRARAKFPDFPELAAADVQLRGEVDYGRDIDELSSAVERSPANPLLQADLSKAYLRVGRMFDAIASARKAAELDPLSPGGTTTYIMTLAHGGQIDTARTELAKAEKLWAGTGSLRDAETAFHVRYGDPAIAMKLDPVGYNTAQYYKTRANPSAANIAKLKAGIDEFRPKSVNASQVGWAIQGLAEFGLVDDVFYWLQRLPKNDAAQISYVLFRPALASARRDPRFMPFAKRIGLVDYWQKSGNWPDFCSRPGISYDCKAEAARLK